MRKYDIPGVSVGGRVLLLLFTVSGGGGGGSRKRRRLELELEPDVSPVCCILAELARWSMRSGRVVETGDDDLGPFTLPAADLLWPPHAPPWSSLAGTWERGQW